MPLFMASEHYINVPLNALTLRLWEGPERLAP
jgi:hypothetical protein